jgi:hypothetical protein
MIAGAANKFVQSGAFTAKDENAVTGEVELVVVSLTALVKSDDPKILALKIFEGANEVDDAGYAEMFGGTGTGFDGHGAQRR